jgi:CHAD domain-containing protein
LQPSDRVRDAARRSLALLYRVASDARTATLEGTDPEGLHDFRVTLRRFRAALRFFRGPLSGTDAAALERDLPRLSDRLGPHRDAEVWESFLAREYPDRPVSGASQARRRRARAALAALLRSASAAGTMRRMARLVRVGIPRGGRKPCGPWSARRLHRIYERVLAHGPLSPAVTPEDAHAFRKRVRRARYFAEMSAPILGAPARDLARRFEKLADALGGLHDADVFLARLRRSRRQDSAALEQKIRSFRQARLNEHLLAWERLSRRKFRKQTLTLLEQWERTR